jgi:hypothetical protein
LVVLVPQISELVSIERIALMQEKENLSTWGLRRIHCHLALTNTKNYFFNWFVLLDFRVALKCIVLIIRLYQYHITETYKETQTGKHGITSRSPCPKEIPLVNMI